jgi:hypothetical protein
MIFATSNGPPPSDEALLATLDRCTALLPEDATADRANLEHLRISVEVRQAVRRAAARLRPGRLKPTLRLGMPPEGWRLN